MPSKQDEILLSDEEKTVALYLVIAVAIGVTAAGLAIGLVIRALPGAGEAVETGILGIAIAILVLTFSAMLFAIFGRWPGTVSSETKVDIAATTEELWEVVSLRPGYPGWKHIYTGIERLEEPGEVYRLHYAEDSDCSRCKLPRHPDRSRWSSRVEIQESRRPSVYRQRSFPKARSTHPMDDFLDCEDSAITLQPLDGGKTRVTFGSTVSRPRMWLAFLTWLGRPGREHLRSLKAHVEGTTDDSLFGVSAMRMEKARRAPRHCACAG